MNIEFNINDIDYDFTNEERISLFLSNFELFVYDTLYRMFWQYVLENYPTRVRH